MPSAAPESAALGVVAVTSALMALAWLGARVLLKGRRRTEKKWVYIRLSGSDRQELLRTYTRAEKLLRSKDVPARRPGETLREYARAAVEKVGAVGPDLAHRSGMGSRLQSPVGARRILHGAGSKSSARLIESRPRLTPPEGAKSIAYSPNASLSWAVFQAAHASRILPWSSIWAVNTMVS